MHEVQILLARQPVHAAQRLAHARRDARPTIVCSSASARNVQAVALEVRDELVEIDRVVRLAEVVVRERAVGELAHAAASSSRSNASFSLCVVAGSASSAISDLAAASFARWSATLRV